jgi:2-phospho-L-lactate guanylyltransferase (CobY/MobA/RfbA family)
VPAHHRRGTNAILCSPPAAVPLRFGEDSFAAHLSAAREVGISPTVLALPGIGLDLDEPEDLAAFVQRPSATQTFALLARLAGAAGRPADAGAREAVEVNDRAHPQRPTMRPSETAVSEST